MSQNFNNLEQYSDLDEEYIQDAVRNRNKKYNEMYNQSKIMQDPKIAYYISNINKALREMINDYRITNTDLYFDNNKHSSAPAASDDILTDFINLAKHFHINLNMNKNTKTSNDTGIAKYVETRRIYGGEVAEIENWPFIVSIHIASRFACAGSIIREDLVLSAASCFNKFYETKQKYEVKNNIWIRAGSDSVYSGGVMVRAVKLHFHSRYNPAQQTNNLVILQLKLKFEFKIGLIQPIRWAKERATYKKTEPPPFDRKRRYRRKGLIVEDRQLQYSVLDKYDMEICKYGYSNSTTMSIRLQDESTQPIELQRGVRQGDVISPKLFTNALEDVFKLLDWNRFGININGEYITHLRFANDIVIMAESLEELNTMLSDLSIVSQQVGLKMNMDKTKIMSNVHVTPVPVIVGNDALEVVDLYVYLGQVVQLGQSISQISHNNSIITKPKDIANYFNDYFINQVTRNDMDRTNKIEPIKNTIFMTPTNQQEVKKAINRLNNTNSIGHDGVCTKIVKICSEEIAGPLAYIFNLMFEQSKFPCHFKLSIIKPIYKKGDINDVSSHRPISIISIFSKISEILIYDRLYNFLEKFHILKNEQNGSKK
ncbi:hypothetical protein MSG28_013899 [Choristoneura fumiferana]|uniref:Uncharacterized protein n=1 Tax=Choristoneura fumiferana TaxID=7141 RepID=A0ACC0K9D2_CHOFU|nr:hypothetical protein MSG28_013899 [Choristoneura fumiferana]